MGSHSLLQGIFLIQGLHQGLLQCRQILYRLSHQGNLVCVYTIVCKIDSWWEPAAEPRELSSELCDDLEGRAGGMGGRSKREGTYTHVHTCMAESHCFTQKLTPCCKTALFQLKTNKQKKNKELQRRRDLCSHLSSIHHTPGPVLRNLHIFTYLIPTITL